MTGAERLLAKGEKIGIQKGEQIGIQKGRSEGILTGKRLVIEKLLQILQNRHMPTTVINELTALLIEELEPQDNNIKNEIPLNLHDEGC